MNTMESILDRVEMVTESGCWIWQGCLTAKGYARVVFNRKKVPVHRLLYEHFRGPIPFGLQPDHICRVNCCANPWHMEAVTPRVNVLRSNNPAACNARKTHCKRGHELAGNNLLTRPVGERACKTCAAANARARWRLKTC